MLKLNKTDWVIMLGLSLLVLIPVVAGGIRLSQVHGGRLTADNARFLQHPLSIILHIISVSLYSVLGVFQFPPGIRHRYPKFHRTLGRVLILFALLSAATGLWMTLVYPWPEFDGQGLYCIRLVVGLAMMYFILASINSIRKRDFVLHAAWMIRAYALGVGAGTQVLTHIPWFVFPTIQGEVARTIFMGLGWLINILVAEWIIKQHFTKRVL